MSKILPHPDYRRPRWHGYAAIVLAALAFGAAIAGLVHAACALLGI